MSEREEEGVGLPSWDEVEKGDTCVRRLRRPEGNERVVKKGVVVEKRRNPTPDGSPGARILSVKFERVKEPDSIRRRV